MKSRNLHLHSSSSGLNQLIIFFISSSSSLKNPNQNPFLQTCFPSNPEPPQPRPGSHHPTQNNPAHNHSHPPRITMNPETSHPQICRNPDYAQYNKSNNKLTRLCSATTDPD